jgi:hypothetical protein
LADDGFGARLVFAEEVGAGHPDKLLSAEIGAFESTNGKRMCEKWVCV